MENDPKNFKRWFVLTHCEALKRIEELEEEIKILHKANRLLVEELELTRCPYCCESIPKGQEVKCDDCWIVMCKVCADYQEFNFHFECCKGCMGNLKCITCGNNATTTCTSCGGVFCEKYNSRIRRGCLAPECFNDDLENVPALCIACYLEKSN